MEYRNLGASGLKVSEICLGTMTFGKYTEAREAGRMVARCLEAGVNFFDTANAYNGGASEEMLGAALKGKRDQAVVATKFFNPMGSGINDSGWSRAHVIRAVDDSLRRLGTDWIDLLYLHHVDADTPLEEVLRTLDDLVRSGKVRYIGCSNFEAWRLMEAWWIAESKGWTCLAAHQPQYSLVVRDIEEEIVPACRLKGVGIVPWGPMAGGYLTGKYRPGEKPVKSGTRSADGWVFKNGDFAGNADAILEELLSVSEAAGKPPAQVALRWVAQRPGVSAVIAGARNLDQLGQNLLSATWRLEPELTDRLSRVSAPAQRYPRSMESGMTARRSAAVAPPAWPKTER